MAVIATSIHHPRKDATAKVNTYRNTLSGSDFCTLEIECDGVAFSFFFEQSVADHLLAAATSINLAYKPLLDRIKASRAAVKADFPEIDF